MALFVKAIQGHRFEVIYLTMLFTGMRRGEVCGLTWDCVDLERGAILINKQLQNVPGRPGEYRLISTKNSRGRTITAASVVQLLRKHRARQLRDRLKAGLVWEGSGLVYCNEAGIFPPAQSITTTSGSWPPSACQMPACTTAVLK